MNCPKCKTKAGKPVRVDPVSSRCPKCTVSVFGSRTGKPVVRGISVKPKPAPAPAPAEKK